jgi:hypothetical protein
MPHWTRTRFSPQSLPDSIRVVCTVIASARKASKDQAMKPHLKTRQELGHKVGSEAVEPQAPK